MGGRETSHNRTFFCLPEGTPSVPDNEWHLTGILDGGNSQKGGSERGGDSNWPRLKSMLRLRREADSHYRVGVACCH